MSQPRDDRQDVATTSAYSGAGSNGSCALCGWSSAVSSCCFASL